LDVSRSGTLLERPLFYIDFTEAGAIDSPRANPAIGETSRPVQKEVLMKTVSKQVVKLGAALVLAGLFAACNQPAPTNSAPSVAETDAVSASISDELMASASTLTLENGLQSLSFSSDGVQAQAKRACVTVNPDPVVDTDGDGVPDNATYTFDCATNRPFFAYTTKGSLQVSDPSSDAGVWGFNSTSDLTHTRTNLTTSKVLTETRKGSRSPRKTGDQITQSHNITVTRSFTGEDTATITNLWNLVFTASTPGSIVMGTALPAGSMTAAGNYAFSKGGLSRTWTISTTSPVQYDPACTDDLKIVGGTLRATLSGPNGNGFLEIQYGACGTDPVITRDFTPVS
jgi:hypothetical protein